MAFDWKVAQILLAFSLPWWACAALAQQQPGDATLKVNPAILIKQFQSSEELDYQIGKGDDVSIQVANRPELSSHQVVGPDGKVSLPVAGSILIAGETREQASLSIEKALSEYYSNVSASVGVERYASNHIFLLGAVEHPGAMDITQPTSLLEVISKAGVPAANIGTQGMPERCAIYRGTDTVVWVDLKNLLQTGEPHVYLRRGDTVYVPSAKDQYISMMGAVSHPGTMALHSDSTLSQLFADAGGVTEKAGKNPQINIITPSTHQTQVVTYAEVLGTKASEIRLHSGDVIYVSESGFNRAAYTIEKISPLMTMFTIAALFAH
jgi:polysaccharide export outer membrane protein